MESLLFQREYPITDKIRIVIPTVGEVIDHEGFYYSMVASLTAMPIDMMVELDDAGIDFTKINEYDLFLILFNSLRHQDLSLIFGDSIDLTKFQVAVNEQNGGIVLVDPESDIVIDRGIHDRIATVLRKIHGLEKNRKTPGNEEARKFLIERARKKARRRAGKPFESQLEQLIISLVNTSEFKYGFDEVRDLTIFQFNESVHQVIKKIDYDNRLYGVYAGTVSVKDLRPEELTWIHSKK